MDRSEYTTLVEALRECQTRPSGGDNALRGGSCHAYATESNETGCTQLRYSPVESTCREGILGSQCALDNQVVRRIVIRTDVPAATWATGWPNARNHPPRS